MLTCKFCCCCWRNLFQLFYFSGMGRSAWLTFQVWKRSCQWPWKHFLSMFRSPVRQVLIAWPMSGRKNVVTLWTATEILLNPSRHGIQWAALVICESFFFFFSGMVSVLKVHSGVANSWKDFRTKLCLMKSSMLASILEGQPVYFMKCW